MNENDFLPEGYNPPDNSSGYMKFGDGVNKFRFLTKPVMGTELWKEEEKKQMPVRIHNGESFSKEDLLLARKGQKPKHFWAAIVWDYQKAEVSQLIISQIGIIRDIATYCRNPKWGSPLAYDIVVTRSGDTKETTKYHVGADPKEELPAEVTAEFAKYTVDLEAFFDGGDVLTKNEGEPATEIDLSDVPFGN